MDKLSTELGRMFAEDFEAIFQKEQTDPTFLSEPGEARCDEAMKMAAVRPGKVLKLAEAYHRENAHEDVRAKTIEEMTAELTENDIKVAQESWWGA